MPRQIELLCKHLIGGVTMALVMDEFYHHAVTAIQCRDPEELLCLFEHRIPVSFAFTDEEMHYSFVLDGSKAGHHRIVFGRCMGGGEKIVIMHRMIEIVPLLLRLCGRLLRESVWNMSDHGQADQVAFCGQAQSVLVPDADFISSGGHPEQREAFTSQPSWSHRSDVPFWRGGSSGHREGPSILDIPRVKLCRYARQHGYDCAISSIVQASGEEHLLHEAEVIGNFVHWRWLSSNRYNIDIDGNSSSWAALYWKLLSGGVVLKVASPHGFRQWYYDRLEPWVNYVPIRSDLSDLDDAICILKADAQLAESIGLAGRELALSMSMDSELSAATRTIVERYG